MTARDPPLLERGDALFLDFDGTLVEIVARPDLVQLDPAMRRALFALQAALDGALAVVSGRRLADVDLYLHPLVALGAGAHGAELRTPHGLQLLELPSQSLRSAGQALRAEFDSVPGVLIEDKALSVALHFRNAPDQQRACEQAAAKLAAALGLHVLHGKRVVELRSPGVDKGGAVRTLLGLTPFHGRRPVFVGDDATDEDAFAAVQAVEGRTVKVGEGSTRARERLPDVGAVRRWLERSAAALGVPVAA